MITLRLWCMVLAPCIPLFAIAQYWAPADLPVVVDGQLSQFYSDEEEGLFCICGRTEVPEGSQSEWRNGLVCNIGGVWDTLGVFDGAVTCAVQYGDTLFVAGHFDGVDGEPMGRILGYTGGTWASFSEPENRGAFNLKKINGELFRLSAAGTLHGQPTTGVSVRQGGQWVPIGNLPSPDTPNGAHWLFDIIEYNGQLVVTGSINATTGYDVFILEGEDWVPLGGGLVGWNSFGYRLAVYQDDLYVGGSMSMAAGDVGQNIIRWDGNQWHPLGSGVQVAPNNFGTAGSVRDMVVHNGELWVCGGFRYAGGVPAQMIARWNGSQWCSVGDGPSDTMFAMGIFQDTLYVNFLGNINGDVMGHVAKFVAPEYENNCGLWTDVEERQGQDVELRAWLQYGAVVLEGLPVGVYDVRIMDATGRMVHQEGVVSDGGRTYLTGTYVNEGIYLVSIPQLRALSKLHIP
jgi:hypothetical protein